MKKQILIVTFVLVNILWSLEGYSASDSPREITLGAILPLTGGMGFLGQQELVGLQLGIADANKKLENNGTRLALHVEDSQSKASIAATVANKLIAVDKIDALFITTSSAVQAVAPIADKTHIPMLAMAGEPNLTLLSPYMFRIYMNFENEAQTIAAYIKQTNYKKLKFIYANLQAFSAESKFLKKYLGDDPGLAIEENTYEYGVKDFRVLLEKVAATQTDAICILGVGPELPVLITQLLGHKKLAGKPIIGGYLFLSEPALAQGTNIYKNLKFASFPIPPESPEMVRFKNHKTRSGKPLSEFADYLYAYDSVLFLAAATELQQKGETLDSAMKRVRQFQGLAGKHNLNNEREIFVEMKMGEYNNGHFQLLP